MLLKFIFLSFFFSGSTHYSGDVSRCETKTNTRIVVAEDLTCTKFLDCGRFVSSVNTCDIGQFNPETKLCDTNYECDHAKRRKERATCKLYFILYNIHIVDVDNTFLRYNVFFLVTGIKSKKADKLCGRENVKYSRKDNTDDIECTSFFECETNRAIIRENKSHLLNTCKNGMKYNPNTELCTDDYKCRRYNTTLELNSTFTSSILCMQNIF